MPQQSTEESAKSGQIDLRALGFTVLHGWRTIGAFVAVFIVWTLISLHLATPLYLVQMQVSTVTGNSDQTPTRSSALSSLAQLAGVNPSANQSASQFRLYIDSIHSRDLANDLANNQNLMMSLYAGEWDDATHTWRERPRGALASIEGTIFAFFGFQTPQWQPPGGARLQKFLEGNIKIIQDIKKPYLVTIAIDSPDPEFAVRLLSTLNQAADDHLRKKAVLRAKQYIDYLSNELNTVTVAEHREAIMQTLSEQEKFAMSAGSAAPYSAELFDRPWASLEPISPKPRTEYLAAVIQGLFFGAAVVLAIRYLGAFAGRQIRRRVHPDKLPRFLRQPLNHLLNTQ